MVGRGRYLRLLIRWMVRIVAGFFFLIILLLFALQIPAVQSWIAGQITGLLSKRTGTEISIERVGIRFPNALSLQGLFVEDLHGDTLLYIGSLDVDVRLPALLRNTIHVKNLSLRDATFAMERSYPDSLFNYERILEAAAGADTNGAYAGFGNADYLDLQPARNNANGEYVPPSPYDPIGPAGTPPENGRSAWTFDIGSVHLGNVRFRLADHFSGTNLFVRLDDLTTGMDTLDIERNVFSLAATRFRGGEVLLDMREGTRTPVPTDDPSPRLPAVALARLGIEQMHFRYTEHGRNVIRTDLGSVDIVPETIDLNNMLFAFSHVSSRASSVALPGLHVSDLDFQIEDILYTPDTLYADLKHMRGREQDGFELKTLRAGIALGRGAHIDALTLETGHSRLSGSVRTSIPPLAIQQPISPSHTVEIDIPEGHIGSDLLTFLPELTAVFPDADAPPVDFTILASGSLDDLFVDTVTVDLDGRLAVNTSGRITGYPDDLYFVFPRIRAWADPGRLTAYIPGGMPTEGLTLPGSLELEAAFEGSSDDMHAEIDLQTDMADLVASVGIVQPEGMDPAWNADLHLISADPLAVVGVDEVIQDIALTLQGSGRGFDPYSMVMEASIAVDSLTLNGYTYRDLALTASADDGLVKVEAGYRDEHLDFRLHNSVLLGTDYPEIQAEWQLTHVNVRELNFTEDMIALQTSLSARFVLREADFPEGTLSLYDTHVLVGRDVFSLDSLIVETTASPSLYRADIRSPIINGTYRGSISPAGIPGVLASHVQEYVDAEDKTPSGANRNTTFTFDMEVMPSPYYSELLLPQISSFQPFTVHVGFDERARMLEFDLDLPEMVISGWNIQDLHVRADSDRTRLDIAVTLPVLESEQVQIRTLKANANLRDHSLEFDVSFDDAEHVSWLGVSGVVDQLSDYTELRLDRSVVFNRQDWTVAPEHFIRIGDTGINAHNVVLTSGEKEIALFSTVSEDMDSPLELHLQNIDLGAFDLIGGSPIAEGIFNGSVEISQIFTTPALTADLSIDGLGFEGETIGDVRLELISPEPAMYTAEASVTGYGNRLEISGSYRAGEDPHIDAELRLEALELSTLEALTADQLSDMDGTLSGILRLQGNPSMPDLDGSIHFDQVEFRVAFLHATYTIPNETIVFDKQQIRFSTFTILDRSERIASLDGYVAVDDLSDIRFDLHLSSGNFLFMDIPRGANELFFGRLLIDTDLHMRGGMDRPVVEGRFTLNQGSGFSVIPPQPAPEAIGDEGVVEFISIHDEIFTDLLLRPEEREPMMSVFENLDISVNIDIDPRTEVRIFIDEIAGDYLELRGGGRISYGVDPGGRISLAGRYEISQGSYQMTFYDVIRRNFAIEAGSNIVWTGDPLDATVDIAAKYTVRTTVRELMASQVPAAGQQETAYRQIYPFEVFLRMKGELMSPEITFEIALPQEHQGAMEGRLQGRISELNESESELNKQVFALLILGSFIQDDPLAAVTGGPGITATARNSASRILSQQLNRLSDRYIRGVDISFELESYEQFDDGQLVGRTELQMEVSRDFLDQRLRITAGGHLELEDETRRQVNPADIAGDFSVEYLLDPAGRFRVRGYRERKFQDVFDGELVETGLSFIFRQTFNEFRELFRSAEDQGSEEP